MCTLNLSSNYALQMSFADISPGVVILRLTLQGHHLGQLPFPARSRTGIMTPSLTWAMLGQSPTRTHVREEDMLPQKIAHDWIRDGQSSMGLRCSISSKLRRERGAG